VSPPVIDWRLIADAVACYRAMGYAYVEAPWIVQREFVYLTLPAGRQAIEVGHGHALVGSAEQSFAELVSTGGLGPGRYVAAGPCFRDEEVVDDVHRPAFMKVELIHVLERRERSPAARALDLAHDALGFFRSVAGADRCTLQATGEGYDVELNGLELGSYGLRTMGDHLWAYGTGCAEPRLSTALHRAGP